MSWASGLDYGTRVVIISGPHKGKVGGYYNVKHDQSARCHVSTDKGEDFTVRAEDMIVASVVDELAALADRNE